MAQSDGEAATVAARLGAQLIGGPPARTVESVVGRLLAVQAQDGRGFRLSVRSRSAGLVASDVEHALSVARSLLVTWLNRGTLHLVEAADYWWLHPLTAPQRATTNQRRLRQEGVTPAQARRGVDLIAAAVASDGPQTREQLRRRLDAARIPTAGQALVHLLVAASLGGHIVRGPVLEGEQAYASVAQWLGAAPAALDRDDALGRLARRYLAGHGPAAAPDLVKWAGMTLADARRGFEVIADEVTRFGDGLSILADHPPVRRWPPPRLLGPFDPILHGWRSRAPLVGPHAGVVTVNGVFRPVALVDGRVVATWGLPGGVPTIRLLEPIPSRVRRALVGDAADVLRFLELPARPPVVTGPERRGARPG